MSIKSDAEAYDLSRQTYQKRLNNWVRARVDGKECLISKKHCMELNEEFIENERRERKKTQQKRPTQKENRLQKT